MIAHAHSATGDYEYFVYPPPFVIALLPFAALPFAVASGLYIAALLVCVAAVLALLEVRDWRCYGVAFATIPTLSAFRLGAVTPLLMLLAALAWRYRNQWAKCGAAVGCATLLKLFLWPLVVWLLLTRRWKAAAAAAGGAAVSTALAWAVLGFKGLGDYPALLRSLSRVEADRSYSLVAVADRLPLPDPQLTWLLLAVPIAVALVATCLTSMKSADSDRRVFVTMIGVALLLTPILWLNYFALLIVPVAMRRKRLGFDWALLVAFWVSPLATPTAHPLWRLVVMLWINQPTQEVGHERGWILPLHGIWSWWPFDRDHWLIVLAVTLPALAAGAGALALLRRRESLVAAGLLLVNVLLYVIWLPPAVYIDDSAASRAALGVMLAALYCLPGWWRAAPRGRVVVATGALALSIGWYLIAAVLLGVSGFQNITT